MPLLYCWKRENYRTNLDMGVGYRRNRRSPVLQAIDPGDRHAAVHRCEAPLDYADLAVSFPTTGGPVQLDRHLLKGSPA